MAIERLVRNRFVVIRQEPDLRESRKRQIQELVRELLQEEPDGDDEEPPLPPEAA